MSKTYTSSYSSGLTLTAQYSLLASTAAVHDTQTSGIAIAGPSGTAWTLTNEGRISATGTNGYGVSFATAGTVMNSGSINGGSFVNLTTYVVGVGIDLSGGGAITNQSGGVITGTTTGIKLPNGGTVDNQSGGTINASQTQYRSGVAIAAYDVATVVNAGDIKRSDIYLAHGGLVSNQSGGTIGNIEIANSYSPHYTPNATATILNAGYLSDLIDPITGIASNAAGGTIGLVQMQQGTLAVSTLVNAGVLPSGVIFGPNGVVSNQSGGIIDGPAGFGVGMYGGTLINAGRISASNFLSDDFGVEADKTSGVWLTNQSSGTIIAGIGIYSTHSTSGAFTAVNAGYIKGTAGDGIRLVNEAASLTNQAGGVIKGSTTLSNLLSDIPISW